MSFIDMTIFVVYLLAMLGVGFYFLKKNQTASDYYVGGRNLGSLHVGLSVVATDVGGGFSIGLGGLGFVMGLSGSWMLFTGLIGAWLSGVFLIPKMSRLSKKINLFTFPQIFEHYYNHHVAFVAGIVSAIGYLGFTSSQLLAGAKLASSTFDSFSLNGALILMGGIAVCYTVIGGIKAVIYTDTVQWIILMSGLIFIGIPLCYSAVGGMDGITAVVSKDMLSFTNLSWQDILNWSITIIPIWFVGMTLYQRIYACKDEKTAKKAWFIAGLFEWPIMAILGVLIGLFARVGFEQGLFSASGYAPGSEIDPEIGLPLMLKEVLPVGLLGLMLSAYFSAVMSTADSCLMAASGNILTDIRGYLIKKTTSLKKELRLSQLITLIIGALALFLALYMENVLSLMLLSYSFMVSGLLVPVLTAVFFEQSNSAAALGSMLAGGLTVLLLNFTISTLPLGLDANIFGISCSALTYFIIHHLTKNKLYGS